MIANHIHDALAQVKTLQSYVLDRKNFKGFSGHGRFLGGVTVILTFFVLSYGWVPATVETHLATWAAVLVLGLIFNLGGLFYWFMYSPDAGRKWSELKPSTDGLPILAVGGVLSFAVILKEQYDLLFGVWFSLYGLTHMIFRQKLPISNYYLGYVYLLVGAGCLLWQDISFVNPWPMGIVFGVGELVGGVIFYRNRYEQEETE
ncbi:MAG: hypothetical protein AAGA18_05260 [Verrucomicrobiota bacterium]